MMEFRQAPSVSIDGDAIRRIREAKKLTQLYISKVVGVTTDTVSRWENNRYPTIRRDNALKLAEALEVGLEEILKHDDVVEEEIFQADEDQRKKRWPLLLLVALAIVAGALLYWRTNGDPPPVLHAERILPANAAPGSRVLVRIKLASDKPLKGMILREEFPKGWKLVEADPPASSVDNLEGGARWIFRNPGLETQISYRLEVAKDAEMGRQVQLKGELIANPDGQRYAVPLDNLGSMQVTPLHWADTNRNQVIDDLEILEVSVLLDEIGQIHLEWDLLEDMWNAGGYRWDALSEQFLPERPEPDKQQQETPDPQ